MAKTIKQKFIIDESGSMSPQQQIVIDGFNEQLETMAKEEAEGEVKYLVSLTKFSEKVTKVFVDLPLAEVPKLTKRTYQPSGGTALFDAVGATIDCAAQGETDCMIYVMTDGQENASKEWKRPAIKTLIDIRQRENKWGFVFFGSNQDAWTAASDMGIQNAVTYTTSNTMGAMRSMKSVRSTYNVSATSGSYHTNNLTCNVNKEDLVK